MKKSAFFISIMVVISSSQIFAQNSNNAKFEFFPKGLHFMPLKANHQEARLGILYFPENGNLKVDIGNTVDLLAFNTNGNKSRFTFGIEFMAYALSTSYSGKRLQIDAIDGFFGGNVIFSTNFEQSKLLSRFRIIHNSAHFVDGHYDRESGKWINDSEPIPFTRDFGELTVAHQIFPWSGFMKYYGSIAYSTLVRPSDLEKYSFNAGFEIADQNLIGEVFNQPTNLFFAYHFSLVGVPKYRSNNNFQLGMKLGSWDGKGIIFYFSYYNGNNFFSEYDMERIAKFGIGFFVDFI